jgi:hypothetical protein
MEVVRTCDGSEDDAPFSKMKRPLLRDSSAPPALMLANPGVDTNLRLQEFLQIDA